MHPLIVQQTQKVLRSSKRVRPDNTIKKEGKGNIKKERIKEEREHKILKREHYVRMHNKENKENEKQE